MLASEFEADVFQRSFLRVPGEHLSGGNERLQAGGIVQVFQAEQVFAVILENNAQQALPHHDDDSLLQVQCGTIRGVGSFRGLGPIQFS